MNSFIELLMQSPLTMVICLLIVIVFFFWLCLGGRSGFLFKVIRFNSKFSSADKITEETIEKDKYLSQLYKTYKSQLYPVETGEKRTRTDAEEYINMRVVLKAMKVNYPLIKAGSSIMVGLGLLGTFLGLTIGVTHFDSASTDTIKESINSLLGGMGSAFMTSIVGMSASLLFTVVESYIFSSFKRKLLRVNMLLNDTYFISDDEYYISQQRKLQDEFRGMFHEYFTYKTAEGNVATVGNAMKVVVDNSGEQTKSLSNLTVGLTDAIAELIDEKLISGFDSGMQPVLNGLKDISTEVSRRLDNVAEKLDGLSKQMDSPAQDATQVAIERLEEAFSNIMSDFNNKVANSANQSMEVITDRLLKASEGFKDYENSMNTMSQSSQDSLQQLIEEIKELAVQNSKQDRAVVTHLQDEVKITTETMNKAAASIEEVINKIAVANEASSNKAIDTITTAVSDNIDRTNQVASELTNQVKNHTQVMIGKVSESVEMMTSNQEDIVNKTEDLLQNFHTVLAKMHTQLEQSKDMNDSSSSMLQSYKEAGQEVAHITNHLTSLSNDVKSFSDNYSKATENILSDMKNQSTYNQETVEQLSESFKEADEKSKKYVDKFQVIEQGLTGVFKEINEGVNMYSRTVRENTQEVLEGYSASLTDAVHQLKGAIEANKDSIDDLISLQDSKKS